MKKQAFIIFTLIIFTQLAFAQNANDLLGKWQSAHGSGQIQIYKKGNLYYGKIVWLREPNDDTGKPKRDIKNPSQNLRSRPIVGLDVLHGFSYKNNGIWSEGKIYDPKSGNTYNCQMTLEEKNKLNIRAYFGISLLGKTETWTRAGS